MIFVPELKSLSIILKQHDQYQVWVEQFLESNAKREKITQGNAILYHHLDAFDSSIFGMDVGKVEDVVGEEKKEVLKVVDDFFKQSPYEYCLVRISQHFIDWIQAFQHHRAYFLDATVEMVRDLRHTQFLARPGNVTEDLTEEMKKQTVEIAQSFCHGRFFTDPDIQKGLEIYQAWIQNSIDKKAADRLFVLYEDEQVHGFASIKKGKLGSLKGWRIQLVGKHGNSNKSAVAETLLREVMVQAKEEGLDYVMIATQATNIPAQRAYQKVGFTPYGSGVTLGWKKGRAI